MKPKKKAINHTKAQKSPDLGLEFPSPAMENDDVIVRLKRRLETNKLKISKDEELEYERIEDE